MISIDLGTIEYYDSDKNEFAYEMCGVVRFEYSLKVIYDWEAKWLKPFLKGGLTDNEMVDFYMMMALDPIKPEFLSASAMRLLSKYIEESHTATVFANHDDGQNGNQTSSRGKVYTAEELYALMFQAQVPIEFETRNLSRLLVVLRIIATYNEPPKKMSQQDVYKQNASINEQRKAMLKSKG